MPEDNFLEARKKIVSILQVKGPSLPVQIAREVQVDSLFAGALLSELADEKKIRISNMKVGGSPLYYLQGQEPKLEGFYKYLPGKEREAFLLLKEKKILEDKSQAPAIRVALRSIKDFSVPFSKDDEVWWRFHTTTEQEVRDFLEPKKQKSQESKIQPKVKPKVGTSSTEVIKEVKLPVSKPVSKEETKDVKKVKKLVEPNLSGEKKTRLSKEETKVVKKIKTEKQLDIGLKNTVKKIVKTVKKVQNKLKEKPDFVVKIIEILKSNNIEILEEKDVKKIEFSCVVRIGSDLGKMRFLCVARDKKRITENDLKLAYQASQSLKMPILVLFPEEVNKKALEFAESCPLLILKKLK